MLTALKKLFWISRPVSWPNTAYPFAAGFLLSGGQFGVLFVIGTVFFLIPYNLLMYGINDVFDYESDIQNPRKGGIEGMREQRSFHPTIVIASLIATVPFCTYLLLQGSMIAKFCFILLIFFVLSYSLKYLRFKERPFIDSITSSIHFVGPLMYALALNGFPSDAWPFVAAFFLWGMASHAFGAVQDILPDRNAHIGSIATILGAKVTVRFAFLLYAVSCTLVILQGFPALFIGIAGIAYMINIFPYLSIHDSQSSTANTGWRHFIVLNYFVGAVVTMTLIVKAAL